MARGTDACRVPGVTPPPLPGDRVAVLVTFALLVAAVAAALYLTAQHVGVAPW
ncbi:hypothetical protein [Mycolicibacterium vanbaalenii]|uniref:hypothetical protein n=1 Tax=Mycolicibacterium vanbaalenii TaxID=110539 RepID=UPI00132FAAAC|nr:hypothetical protein [Mycolicibacterium vanbaalenii]